MKNRAHYIVAVLLIGIMVTGYGGLCDKKKSKSGSSGGGTTTGSSGAPAKASNPSPSNGATGTTGTSDPTSSSYSFYSSPIYLGWTTSNAASQDFYIGTTTPPPFNRTITNPTLDVVRGMVILTNYAKGTTYYWRVDTKNSYGTTTGDVWSFGH